MPISTNLDVTPYVDDFNPNNNYYRILFKPGAAVQVRELNQLQTTLAAQIEQFGDNIFTPGTIVQGCNFIFYNNYPYIKLVDNDLSGSPIDVQQYIGLNLRDGANLVATVLAASPGFVSQNPNLNTLYIKYLNSGNTNILTSYTAGETLTAYSPNNGIEVINILNGSSGFSNSDNLIIVSAIGIQNSSGGTKFANGTGGSNTFNIGDTINYVGISANVRATILSINSTANSSDVILQISPFTVDLQNTSATFADWTFPLNVTCYDLTTNTQFTVTETVGSGASGTLLTNGFGVIDLITITATGGGYYVLPTVTSQSANGTISNLNLQPQNFLDQFNIATVANAVGNGYAFAVTPGVIYNKGYFVLVTNTISTIVSAYNNSPNGVSVGFNTEEILVNTNINQSLLDNSQGSPNFAAPGADRLQLSPTLIVLSTNNVAGNVDFFPICQWSNGQPYNQNQPTSFDQISNIVAQAVSDAVGDYVVNPFAITTKSSNAGLTAEANTFSLTIDPGSAYVDGSKVTVQSSFSQTINKAITTFTNNLNSLPINYGKYVVVNNFAGSWIFDTGTFVSLRNAAATYVGNVQQISSTNSTNITQPGSEIGQARIRYILNSNRSGSTNGTALVGTPAASYNMYLWNITMNTGQSFNNVQSILISNTPFQGITDVVNPGPNSLQGLANNTLIFPLLVNAVYSISNVSYTYGSATSATVNTSGYVTFTAAAGETFFNSNTFLYDTVLVPQANLYATANASGTVNALTSSPVLAGTGTSFTSQFVVGDYIHLGNSTANDVHRIVSIINNTSMTVESNISFANNAANLNLFFPHNIPISLTRAGRTTTLSSGNTVLTIYLANSITSQTNATLIYTVSHANATPISKTVHRNCYVMLDLANNVGGNTGPWFLGVPEVIRLDAVYLGNSTVQSNNVTTNFYINGGQLENSIECANLALVPGANISFPTGTYLLVKFDCLTSSSLQGFATKASYPINDNTVLSSATSTINTLEIPELYGVTDTYYDLRDCIDFRPISVNTAAVTNVAASATINPTVPTANVEFGNTLTLTNNKRFPTPFSVANVSLSYYLGRNDLITLTSNGNFNDIQGIPAVTANNPAQPADSLILNNLLLPPYPTLPQSLSANVSTYADTGIVNKKASGTRVSNYTVYFSSANSLGGSNTASTQPTGYTMERISELEKRIENLEALLKNNQLSTAIKASNQTGYFIDDFSSLDFSNQQDPGYNTSIINNELCPRKIQIILPYTYSGEGIYATYPSFDYPLVQQLNATDGCSVSNVAVSVPLQQVLTNFNTESVSTPDFFTYIGQPPLNYQYVWDIYNFTFSANSGPVTLFIEGNPQRAYFPQLTDADLGIGLKISLTGCRVYVFQSNSAFNSVVPRQGSTDATINNPLATYTGWSPYLLTTSDSATDLSLAQKQSIGDLGPDFSFVAHKSGVGNCVFGLGQVTWTHDPVNGENYQILVLKGSPDYFLWLNYPIDAGTISSCNTEFTSTLTDYHGSMNCEPTTFEIRKLTHKVAVNAYDYKFNYDVGGRLLSNTSS